MSTPSPIPSDISRTTAPLLLGALFNWFLYGILVVQVYSYHQYFPRDRGYNKILVHAIFIIETAQTLLSGADSSYWFVSGFGNFGRLRRTFLAPVDGPILNLFVSITVRSVFCYRIWCIKKSMFWWCCVIGALSLVQCIGNLADGILGFKHRNIDGPHIHVYFIYIGMVSSATADVAVTATLTYLLAHPLKRESETSMERAWRRILHFTVETNFISASVSALCLVMFAAAPNDVYWFCPAIVTGKVYSNTLLASFNNRILLKDHRRNASAHISTTRAGTPVQIQRNSSRVRTFAERFVGKKSYEPKSAPPFIASFDRQQKNLEEKPSPSRQQGQPLARALSMQCIHSPQYPPALAPSPRQRIEVPLSATLGVSSRMSDLPIRPLPPTPTPF
ncbi:hypothetical protein EDB85DRAFT_2127248 [Lactarius pseudohatsudake]|nr:hypothetical protein EDB85DRAFT_2127248 [Lactarius pseudohatsudake]